MGCNFHVFLFFDTITVSWIRGIVIWLKFPPLSIPIENLFTVFWIHGSMNTLNIVKINTAYYFPPYSILHINFDVSAENLYLNSIKNCAYHINLYLQCINVSVCIEKKSDSSKFSPISEKFQNYMYTKVTQVQKKSPLISLSLAICTQNDSVYMLNDTLFYMKSVLIFVCVIWF